MDPLLSEFDAQLRNVIRPAFDGAQFERAGRVIRCVSPDPDGWSGVEWSDLDTASADAAIAEQVEYFTTIGRKMEWKYYTHDRPEDLPDRLRAAGLVPGPEEALMIADVSDLPSYTPPPAGVEIREATSDEDLALVKQVHDVVFDDDHTSMMDSLRSRMRDHPGSLIPVLAVAGDEAVSASRVDFHVDTEFASLWGGGTMPAWRGRGIYRAMVSYRARLAADRGYRYLRTDALPTSRPILERLGFRRVSTTIPFTPAG
jgi:GNAT superfamily N-acetyltransferase